MPNEVSVHRESSAKPQAPIRRGTREWDPFRAMRDLMRWEPFAELAPSWPTLEGAVFAPDFEVKETKDAFAFTADLPGVTEKDLQVQLSENRLSISGKRESEKTEQGETYYTAERNYGSFTRSFTFSAMASTAAFWPACYRDRCLAIGIRICSMPGWRLWISRVTRSFRGSGRSAARVVTTCRPNSTCGHATVAVCASWPGAPPSAVSSKPSGI